MNGTKSWQGGHQGAMNSNAITLPRKSDKDKVFRNLQENRFIIRPLSSSWFFTHKATIVTEFSAVNASAN